MFKGNDPSKISNLYGKGFSLYNRLDIKLKKIESDVDIRYKIKEKFYTRIIYGSIKRCALYLEEVLKVYAKDEIAFIDGEDSDFSFTNSRYNLKHAPSIYRNYRQSIDLSRKGIYFKRELRDCDRKYFYPVFFAIPEENIIKELPQQKTRESAFIIPGDLSTYIYNNEKEYYNGYAVSKYALTSKKGGWDCLRHYEILANGCIPYFLGIEKCPRHTMHLFPKNMIAETNELIRTNKLNDSLFNYYNNALYQYTKNCLTTKSLAQYVLSILA
jgi:hypothetical protein